MARSRRRGRLRWKLIYSYFAAWCNGSISRSAREAGGSSPHAATIERGVTMKNFLMRGVVLVTLLSFLVLPASAAFSNTDSTNIANIKSYTYDMKVALTSGTLFTNVSAIKTSVANISSTVSSIYTQIQATNNHLSTNNTKVDTSNGYLKNIQDYIGTSTTYKTVNGLLQLLLTKQTSIDTNVGAIKTSASSVNTKLDTSNSTLGDIKTGTDYLSGISAKILKGGWATELMQNNIYNKINGFATEETVSKLGTEETLESTRQTTYNLYSEQRETNRFMEQLFGQSQHKYSYWPQSDVSSLDYAYAIAKGALPDIAAQLTNSSFVAWASDGTDIVKKTIFGHLENLSDTLASDQDKAIRDAQNDNVSVVQDEFVSGSSNVGGQGSTGRASLGKGDFQALGGFGSTGRGGFGLNGQATVDSFNTGLDDANTSGLDWFSSDTKNALDIVTSSSSTSSARSRAPALDSDPYNMSGFTDNYNWVFGGD